MGLREQIVGENMSFWSSFCYKCIAMCEMISWVALMCFALGLELVSRSGVDQTRQMCVVF